MPVIDRPHRGDARALHEHERIEPDPADQRLARLQLLLIRRRGQAWLLEGSSPKNRPDPILVAALRTAHAILRADAARRPVLDAAPETPHRRRLVRLAFLAPDIQRAIFNGRQPASLTLGRFLKDPISLDWSDQAARFGFAKPRNADLRARTRSV